MTMPTTLGGERLRILNKGALGNLYAFSTPRDRQTHAPGFSEEAKPENKSYIRYIFRPSNRDLKSDEVNEIRVSPNVPKEERDRYLLAASRVLSNGYRHTFDAAKWTKKACYDAVFQTTQKIQALRGLEDFELDMPVFTFDKEIDTEGNIGQTGQCLLSMRIPGSQTFLTFDPGAYLFNFSWAESAVIIGDLDFTTRMFNDMYSKKVSSGINGKIETAETANAA